MKILLVDGETKAGDCLRQGLVEAGFTVDLAGDHRQGLQMLRQDAYALVIFDTPVRDGDRLQLREWVDREDVATQVLLLTAPDHVKVIGNRLGSDADWPFRWQVK